MKILACSLTYPLPNGVTVSIDLQAKILKELGHDFLLLGPKYDTDVTHDYYKPINSSTISKYLIGWFGRKERMFSIDAAAEIKKIVRNYKPDIMWLQSVTWAPNAFERVMIESDCKKFLTYHTMVADYGKQYAGTIGSTTMELRSVELIKKMDRVFTPSQPIVEYLHKIGVKKEVAILPTPIRESENFSSKHDGKTIIYVGRVVREKNIEVLLQAAVKSKVDDLRLLLVGPSEKPYVDYLRKKYPQPWIEFVGAVDHQEIDNYFAQATIFAFPSLTETQGLVLGEAMIRRIPVVALRSKISSYCYPDTAALLADDTHELSVGIKKLLDNPTLREEYAQKGYNFVKDNFSESIVKESYKRYLDA